MIVYMNAWPDDPGKQRVAMYVPPKNAGSSIRKYTRNTSIAFRKRTGHKSPIGWQRSLYRDMPEHQRLIGFVREPVSRFKALFETRQGMLETITGRKIGHPMEILSHKFWHSYIWPLVPRLLEAWNYPNTRVNWHTLDICRHFLPQAFTLGTAVRVDHKGRPTGERKVELFDVGSVDAVVLPILKELSGVSVEPIKRNPRGWYARNNDLRPTELDDETRAAIREFYSVDFDLFKAAKKL